MSMKHEKNTDHRQPGHLPDGDRGLSWSCQYLLATGGMIPLAARPAGAHLRIHRHGGFAEPRGGHLGRAEPGPRGLHERGRVFRHRGLGLDAAAPSSLKTSVVRLLLSMIVGGVFAGVAGVLIGIPVLRLRGDYLAIVTLAFGEIIRNVINCLYISIDAGRRALRLQRQQHPRRAPRQRPRGRRGRRARIATFVMGFALILFTLFVVLNLVNSRSGRAIMAMPRQPHRRRVRGHQHHQVPDDGLRDLAPCWPAWPARSTA